MVLINTQWLQEHLQDANTIILDATWHLPNANRNPLEEFNIEHIPNAIFFDIDKFSDQSSKLPHMLCDKDTWEEKISKLGINNKTNIIIYDNSNLFSSCRVWFNFLYYGHPIDKIFVLNSDIKTWKKEDRKVTNSHAQFSSSQYTANENSLMVKNYQQIKKNLELKKFVVIDARSKARFDGTEKEPRAGLKSGHIENSLNLPFSELVNTENHSFKEQGKLKAVFVNHGVTPGQNLVFSCGSGVTACVLGLANYIVSGTTPVIYDGSWTEYGSY